MPHVHDECGGIIQEGTQRMHITTATGAQAEASSQIYDCTTTAWLLPLRSNYTCRSDFNTPLSARTDSPAKFRHCQSVQLRLALPFPALNQGLYRPTPQHRPRDHTGRHMQTTICLVALVSVMRPTHNSARTAWLLHPLCSKEPRPKWHPHLQFVTRPLCTPPHTNTSVSDRYWPIHASSASCQHWLTQMSMPCTMSASPGGPYTSNAHTGG